MNGLKKDDRSCKLLALESYFSLSTTPLLIGVSEHWKLTDDQLPALPNYTCFASCRKSINQKACRGSGGVAAYVRSDFAHCFSVHKTSTSGDVLWLKLNSSPPTFIAICYIRPIGSNGFQDEVEAEWSELGDETGKVHASGSRCIFLGDFNARVGTLDDRFPLLPPELDFVASPTTYLPPSVQTDLVKNASGTHLIELCHSADLFLANGRFSDSKGSLTSFNDRGSSCVDYAILSHDFYSQVISFEVLPLLKRPEPKNTPLSDHCPISLTLSLSFQSSPKTSIKPQNCSKFPRYSKAKAPQFRLEVSNTFSSLDFDYTSDDLLSCSKDFSERILSTASHVFGTKSNSVIPDRFKQQPWFDSECKQLRRKVKQVSPSSPLFPPLHKEYISLCARKKKQYNLQKETDFISSLSSDPHKAWSQFNPPHHVPLPPADKLFDSFKALFSNQIAFEKYDFPTKSSLSNDAAKPLTAIFSENEISVAISKLKNNKSPDIFGMRAEFLKVASDSLVSHITTLFNRFFTEGFPTDLSNAFICPIHKKGDPSDPGNYRGIAIITILSKLYASCLESRLSSVLEQNDLRAAGQAGFRKQHRCSDQIFILNCLREQALEKKKNLYCCFVDFAKAFDSIPRPLLFSRLESLGVPSEFIEAIKSYYLSVNFCVKTTDGFSSSFPSSLGVKQGCPLSPTLFGIFIDYFEEFLLTNLPKNNTVHLLLYADDIILATESDVSLHAALVCLEKFAALTTMAVNVSKTKILIFRKKKAKPPIFTPFIFIGEAIEVVSEFRYLGFTFHEYEGLDFGSSVLLSAGKRALFALKSRCHALHISHFPTILRLFHTLVTPVLLYSSEVWFPFTHVTKSSPLMKTSKLELFFRSFLRSTLGIRKSVPNEIVYLESGQNPLFFKAFDASIKYLNRLTNPELVPTSRMLYKVFDRSLLVKKSWLHSLVSLYNHAFNESFEVHRDPLVLKHLGPSLTQSHAYQTSTRQVCSRPVRESTEDQRKLFFYKSIWKGEHESLSMPAYLSVRLNKYTRSLSALRCSSHNLRIEFGTFENLPREARTCCLCNKAVETEDHFLLSCPSLQAIRSLPDFSKIVKNSNLNLPELLSSVHYPINGKFIYQLLQRRAELLSNTK